MPGLDTHCPAEEVPPAQMCVGWLAAGIMSPDPCRKQPNHPRIHCSTSVFKEHPPLGAIHQPERNAKKDYLILYTDLTKNAGFNYFGNAWQSLVSWVFWISAGTARGRAQYGATTDQVPVSPSSARANIPAFGLGLLWLKKLMQRLRISIRDYRYCVGEILS